jgi:hypothetical protein
MKGKRITREIASRTATFSLASFAVAATLVTASIALGACKFIDMKPLEIERVEPAGEIVDVESIDTIEVFFSADVDKTLTEGAFSLLEDGIRVAGTVAWPRGDRLSFSPFERLVRGKAYSIQITTQAEDVDGNSLKDEFARTFRSSTDSERPRLVSVVPAPRSLVSTLRPEITLSFSEPMDKSSVIEAFSLSPDADGYFAETSDLTGFRYVLTEDLDWQTNYSIEVAEDARDLAGNSLGKKETRAFFTGTDSEMPSVASITATGTNLPLAEDNLIDAVETVTEGVARKDAITIRFSEPMDESSTEGAISFTPQVRYETDWNESRTELALTPTEGFAWNALISLTVAKTARDLQGNALARESIWKFRANSVVSRPPRVVSVSFLNGFDTDGNPTASGLIELSPLGSFAFDERFTASTDGAIAFFDVYLNLAEGAALPLAEFVESFSVSVGGAAITPFACQIDDRISYAKTTVPVNGGAPLPPGMHVARYLALVSNYGSRYESVPGLLTVSLAAGFADSLGNELESAWTVTVVTTN